MRRLHAVLSLFVIAVAATISVAGPELDRARRYTASVRRSFDDADRALRNLDADRDRISREMDRLRDKQREIDRTLDRLRDAKRDLPGKIRDEEDRLRRLGDDEKKYADALASKRLPLKDAGDKLSLVQGVLDQVIRRHVAALEASLPFQRAKAAAEAAVAATTAAHKAVVDRVRSSPAYVAAVAKHEESRKRMVLIRADESVTAGERAAGAQAVIDTEKTYTRMEIDALAIDEALTSAKAGQKRADFEFKSLVEDFRGALPAQSDVAESQQRVDAAKRALELLIADAKRTETALADTRRSIEDSKIAAARMKQELAATDVAMDMAAKDIAQISRDLDQLAQNQRNLDAVETRLRRDVDIWDRRYRDALAAERTAARRDEENAKKDGKVK